MRMAVLGTIATSIVITVGVLLALGPAIIYAFYHNPPPVLLSFSIVNGSNVPDWCNGLASVLAKQQVNATVFITGEVAEAHPECVRAFVSQGSDVGSQTYRYVNLNEVSDYQYALEEVKMGKQAVDNAGGIDSHVFRAPFGETNDNIYSLLSRSNLTADFSYAAQYNLYEDNQFVKHDLVSCDCRDSPGRVKELAERGLPILINMDNDASVSEIQSLIISLKENDMKFDTASELTETDLTIGRSGSTEGQIGGT